MGEAVFGEDAPVAVEPEQQTRTNVETVVLARVVHVVKADGAVGVGNEEAGALIAHE